MLHRHTFFWILECLFFLLLYLIDGWARHRILGWMQNFWSAVPPSSIFNSTAKKLHTIHIPNTSKMILKAFEKFSLFLVFLKKFHNNGQALACFHYCVWCYLGLFNLEIEFSKEIFWCNNIREDLPLWFPTLCMGQHCIRPNKEHKQARLAPEFPVFALWYTGLYGY